MRQTAPEARIELIAEKYWSLLDTIAALERERAAYREQLEEWMADNNEDGLVLEGLGELVLRSIRTRTYDVKAIRESNPSLFDRLLDLGVLDVSKTRLDANAPLIGQKVPCFEGETRRLERKRK